MSYHPQQSNQQQQSQDAGVPLDPIQSLQPSQNSNQMWQNMIPMAGTSGGGNNNTQNSQVSQLTNTLSVNTTGEANTSAVVCTNFGNVQENMPQMMSPQQHSQQSPHQQMMIMGAGIQGMGQNAQNLGNQGYKQALQQLLITLKNQISTKPDHQQKILNILKSNPQLMSAFIKHRQKAQKANSNSSGVISKENILQQAGTQNAQGDASVTNPSAMAMQSGDNAPLDVAATTSSLENSSATNQANESAEQDEIVVIMDDMIESNQQNSWVIVKNEAPDTITAEQIIAHRRKCEDFNCPACLPMNLAIREMKTSRQNIDNILALLEVERDDSE